MTSSDIIGHVLYCLFLAVTCIARTTRPPHPSTGQLPPISQDSSNSSYGDHINLNDNLSHNIDASLFIHTHTHTHTHTYTPNNRRGADRSMRDSEDMLPLDYAEQKGHNDCIKLLQTYGLRRPLSAVSHVTLPLAAATPTVDEHGHVQLKNPTRQFSLSGESLTSFDHRLPADGQAQSEDGGMEETERSRQLMTQTSTETGVGHREEGEGEQNQWAESRQSHQVSLIMSR